MSVWRVVNSLHSTALPKMQTRCGAVWPAPHSPTHTPSPLVSLAWTPRPRLTSPVWSEPWPSHSNQCSARSATVSLSALSLSFVGRLRNSRSLLALLCAGKLSRKHFPDIRYRSVCALACAPSASHTVLVILIAIYISSFCCHSGLTSGPFCVFSPCSSGPFIAFN